MKSIRNYFIIVLVLLVAAAVFNPPATGASESPDYGYRRKDADAERKKYLRKLAEDKKKVELAVRNTKRLIDRSRNKPYLPELYLRLAELYVEQSRLAFFMRKSERPNEKSMFDQLESNTLKNQALEIYQRILDGFPEYEDRDKVHFFMAHEHRELNQLEEMVQHYRVIIKKYPKSHYVPEAYLLLGDHFIQRQDLDTAKKHYIAVLDHPESPAIAIARYKLAWCHINRAEFKKAIELFEEAVQCVDIDKKIDIDTYKRVDIRFESLIDMAYCYGECYKKSTPQEALAYFEKFAWSRPVYTAVLEKLAYRYFIKKKWRHAAEVYRELAKLKHDPEKLLEYARNVFECTQATGVYGNADKDMELIVKALRKQKYSIHIDEKEKQKNLADYELYARNIATHLHEQARKRKSLERFKLAADAYRLYLEFFDESPARREMALNYAETLFSSRQYLDAGKQYEALMTLVTLPEDEKEELTYGAVISYYNALKQKENLNYYQAAFARDGLRSSGRQYAARFPNSKRVPDVLFNVAWIAYDAGKYEDAISEFRKFIEEYPRGKAATAAIHLILDSYNLREDYDGLIAFGNEVIAKGWIRDPKMKAEVAQIVSATESKVISSLTLSAMDDWEKGKSELKDYAAKSDTTGLGEQALYALMVASKEKGDLASLLSAGKDITEKFPDSPQVEDTLEMTIDATIKTAQFRLLADQLETFTNVLPKNVNTADFLYQAGKIREKLGQFEKSNIDLSKVLEHKGSNGIKQEDVIFIMAQNARRSSGNSTAIAILANSYKGLSKSGRVRADALMADMYRVSGKNGKALACRKKAYRTYTSQMGKKDPEIRDAMAKMVYHAVDRKNQKYMAIRMEKTIDNAVVTAKTKMLTELEKGYLSVIQYQSPVWALTACYRAHEINQEFARFLKESPVPDLSPEQKEQYVRLIGGKAQAYLDKAQQYRKTCIQQAHKWEICDPELMAFYMSTAHGDSPFSGRTSAAEIGEECLQDAELRRIHEGLLQKPDDTASLYQLSKAYLQKGDYRHSILISEKALGETKGNDTDRAMFHNLLGIAQLYIGEDAPARDSFKAALELDGGRVGAAINLAALMNYYGHVEKAAEIVRNLSPAKTIAWENEMIHPRAQEFYNVHNRLAKN